MYSAKEVAAFIKKLKQDIPNASVWIYSGFTYEDIQTDSDMFSLLKLCDVLVDGEFVLEQRDITLPYKGSRNQRIIDIQRSIDKNEIVIKEF